MESFRHTVEVRWADCDANQHVRHSAFADYCTHARIEWLKAHDFGFDQFQAHHFGPVIFKEWTEYYKELRMSERVMIEVRIAGLSSDGSRFRIRHDLIKEDNRPAARHEVQGAWFDTKLRKLILPPQQLADIFGKLNRTDDFEEIALKAA